MKQLIGWFSRKWNVYKYRFVPWIALNLNDKTATVVVESGDIVPKEQLLQSLKDCLCNFVQYSSLKEDLTLYDNLHVINQDKLLKTCGFTVVLKPSSIPGAGRGVFINQGSAPKGRYACNTVHSVLFQILKLNVLAHKTHRNWVKSEFFKCSIKRFGPCISTLSKLPMRGF